MDNGYKKNENKIRAMLHVKELQSELTQARAEIQNLNAENRIFKMMEKRQETALSKYEDTHAQLPQVIKSYSEDLRILQNRLRRTKEAYRQLEKNHLQQGAQLSAIQKQHKHLLDLTKNKQLGEREKLSNQLEETENAMKQLEKKNQNLVKTIELQTKNYQNQLDVETGKAKALQVGLKRVTEENRILESKLEKFKYQSYGGKRAYYNASEVDRTNCMARPKTGTQSISVPPMTSADGNDHSNQSLPDCDGTSIKQEVLLVHGESSEISDHTEELQMNLMRQVHEDVINAPNMLVREIPDSSDSTLIQGISTLVKKECILSGVGSEENTILQEQTTPATDGYRNPFSLSDPFRPSTATKKKFDKLERAKRNLD